MDKTCAIRVEPSPGTSVIVIRADEIGRPNQQEARFSILAD